MTVAAVHCTLSGVPGLKGCQWGEGGCALSSVGGRKQDVAFPCLVARPLVLRGLWQEGSGGQAGATRAPPDWRGDGVGDSWASMSLFNVRKSSFSAEVAEKSPVSLKGSQLSLWGVFKIPGLTTECSKSPGPFLD